MLKMFGPGAAIDDNIVKEHQDAATQEWLKHQVHQGLEC
jgi:hypothetical protein